MTTKTWRTCVLVGAFVAISAMVHAAPLGTAFTYQGQLKKDGQRVSNTCNFQFILWDDAGIGTCPAGGNPIGPVLCFAPVPTAECGIPVGPPITVTEGLFTVQLDFGVSAIDGTARWLGIAVQCPGDGPFTHLCPRQELTPAPYAHRANMGVGTLDGLNVTTADNVGIGTLVPDAKLEVVGEGSAGDYSAVSVRNSNGDSLFFVGDEGRISLGKNLGTPDFAVQSGPGVIITSQGDTELNLVGSETQGNVGVASIIFHNTHSSEPKKRVALIVASVAGLSGAHLDFNTEDGSFTNQPPKMRITSSGNVGIGRSTNPETVLDIQKGPLNTLAPALHMLRLDHPGVAEYAAGIDNGVFLLEWTGENPGVTQNFGADDGYLGIAINSVGNVGIGTTLPTDKLTVCGSIRASGSINANAGCDVAEAFELSEREKIVPGMVMVLDPDRPGHLRISMKAYDTKVAGIVSGAKGTWPGVLLGGAQSEPRAQATGPSTTDAFMGSERGPRAGAWGSDCPTSSPDTTQTASDLPIALSGRVYCLVDATKRAVKVGDLLTTSDTPGYAMKVTNFRKSQGAVLGKAMEPLAKGEKGLILVLVGLQ